MRWTWWRRRRPDDAGMQTMADSAQQRLDEAERMAPQVARAVGRLERVARRNNFAPMIRRALGDYR